MKTILHVVAYCLPVVLATQPTVAQTDTATWSGQIMYEGVHKIDPTLIRIKGDNGELLTPGDPDWPKDLPENRMSEQRVLVHGSYAKVTGNNYQVMPTVGNRRPFTEQFFVDLKALKKVTILTVGNEADAKVYQAEVPIPRVSGWQFTDQTRKIAGYTCRKATVPYKKETYTVWITTELPLTYSPIQELTPDTGTVLLIEGSKEQFKATRVAKTALDSSVVKPRVQAQTVSPDQLPTLRQQAITNFMQKHGNGRPGHGG
ncbi:hypothetical protein [Fibrella arboris]|uniref:hypothetical protein n=1 Tax=Fibrella arboris TaxID=3242486 RepID=UPI0035217F2D